MIALLALLLATIPGNYVPSSYGCNGVQTVFSVGFPYLTQGDLYVTSTTAGGNVTTLILTTDYTVNLTSTQTTATLTLITGSRCPNGSTLKIARVMQIVQPTNLRTQGPYQPATVELMFDRGAMLSQQLNSQGVLAILAAPLSQANGGTGSSTLTCTSTQLLTSNGTSVSCVIPPGMGTTGSTVPTTAEYQGGRDSNGNLLGLRICDTSLSISATSLNGSQQLVAGVAAKKIYVCGGYLISSAAVSVKFTEGTGSNCGTGTTDVTGAAPLAANGGYTLGLNAFATPFTATAANALCVNTSGSSTLGGWVAFTQQ